MKKLFALLLLLSATLFAETTFERSLQSIDYRSQAGATIVLITLSDNSVWKWTPDPYSENLLRKWTEGDPIIIQAVNHPGFILQNLAKPHYEPSVALSFNSYLIFPSLQSYEKAYERITLSDGSKWELVYDFNKRTLYHWALTDRIIPVKGVNGNYELINIDVPHDNRGQIERCIEVYPVTDDAEHISWEEDLEYGNVQNS